MRRPNASRAGFSLIELVIAITLLSMLLGSAALATQSSYDAYRSAKLLSRLNDQARRTLDRVAASVVAAGSSPPPQALASSRERMAAPATEWIRCMPMAGHLRIVSGGSYPPWFAFAAPGIYGPGRARPGSNHRRIAAFSSRG